MRLNERIMYNITIRAAWAAVKKISADPENMGGLPGMVTVLHTFGSDMKYHVQVHALITFGGVDENGNWVWPKHKKRIAKYRKICKAYRKCFMELLYSELRKGDITPVEGLAELLETIEKKRWNVRNGYPTTDTTIIERYLARYINRISISKSRLQYLKGKEKNDSIVHITYKDYTNQKDGQAAPLEIAKIEPLVAIHNFLTHVLPPYFQKSRYHGLHHHSIYNKYKDKLDAKFKRNKNTIANLFALLRAMTKQDPVKCDQCGKEDFETTAIAADMKWIFNFITIPNYRGPPFNKFRNAI